MNAKSRGFGLLAAVALSLSMFGGAIAQSSDSESVSTVLTGNAGPLCGINIYAVAGGLGAWEYDGAAYVETSGTSTQSFFGDLFNIPALGCNVSVTFGGLTGPGGVIGTENFSAYSVLTSGSVDPAAHGADNVSSFYDFDYTLNSVPSSLTEGTYTGTIGATVSNAS